MAQLTTAPAGGRDNRVDFFRGVALAMIFVNHVPGTFWEHLTTRNFGFSDSAELFVYLAGFASAFAYGRLFLGGSMLVASLKALRRSGVLYLVHITVTMLTVALFANAALMTGNGRYLETLGIGYFLTMSVDMLARVPLLGYQIAYVNILPMYSAILAFLPLMLLVVRFAGTRGLLAASGAVWVACGIWRFNLPNWTYGDGWGFNPFAWQFVFAIGLFCGFAKMENRVAVPFRPVLYAAALAYLLFSWQFIEHNWWGRETYLPLPSFIRDFDKPIVSLPRLLHLLALVYVFAYAPSASPLQRVGRSNPFTMLGRHSLPIFAVGTMLAMICQVLKLNRDVGFAADTLLLSTGLALQFALARALDWWREASRALPAVRPKVEPSAAASAIPASGPISQPLAALRAPPVA